MKCFEAVTRRAGRGRPRDILPCGAPRTSFGISRVGLTRLAGSPALLARERQIFERYTTSLAAVIAEEEGSGSPDVEPWVVANALMGVHRALVKYTHRQILGGAPIARISREVRSQAEEAFGRLEHGLNGYVTR